MLKRSAAQKLFLKNAVFQTVRSALFAVTGSKDKTLVSDKLRDHSDHVLIRHKSQQLASKATMQDNVICRYQIDKKSSMFSVNKMT